MKTFLLQTLKQNKWLVGMIILFCLESIFFTFFTGYHYENFPPFPDTIYYIYGAKNFLLGNGFVVQADNPFIASLVPFFYPFIISIPFSLTQSLYSFYIMNLGLAVGGLILFALLVRKYLSSSLLQQFFILLYTINFIFFWFPSLVMAENLLLFLVVLSLYLFDKRTPLYLFLLGVLSVLFLMTKFVALPIMLTLIFCKTLAIIFASNRLNGGKNVSTVKYFLDKVQRNSKNLLTLGLPILLTLMIFILISNLFSHQDIIEHVIKQIRDIFKTVEIPAAEQAITSGSYYESKFLSTNMIQYLSGLIGGEIVLAGNREINLLPPMVSFFGLFGYLFALIQKRNRLFFSYILGSLIFSVSFLLFFFQTEARYLIAFIPALFLLIGYFFDQLLLITKDRFKLYAGLLTFLVLCSAFVFQLRTIWTQYRLIQTDVRLFAQNYDAVKVIDRTLTSPSSKKKYVITTLPDHYIRLFKTGNYELLPVSGFQFFAVNLMQDKVDFYQGQSVIPDYYEKLVTAENESSEFYISDYATSALYYHHIEYLRIIDRFRIEPVQNGCESRCNIYRLYPKTSDKGVNIPLTEDSIN